MQLLMLILLINGLYFGLRGCTEHCYLSIKNIDKDTFEVGHPFYGYEYIELVNLTDKTHKLTVHNSWRRDTKGSLRLPILPEQKDSPGTIYWKFLMDHVSPGQERLFCKPASIKQKYLYTVKGFPTAMYSAVEPLGKNSITGLFKQCAELLGIEVQAFSGHALRRECISKMVNNNVPIAEAMATARHSSVSASLAYHKRPVESEVAKFKAFGILPPTNSY